MIFTDASIIEILLDNNFKPEITIITLKSCYKGCSYKVEAPEWCSAVRIRRNGRYTYYHSESYKLTEKTYKLFKNLKASQGAVDFFKKDVEEDDILFNYGRLFKVVKIFNDYTYVKMITEPNEEDEWDWVWDDWISERSFGNNGLQIQTSEISTFIKIIDPLDLLTI